MTSTEQLVGYGVQRGRAREVSRILDDLLEMLADPMATEEQLRAYVRQLDIQRSELEQAVANLEQGNATLEGVSIDVDDPEAIA